MKYEFLIPEFKIEDVGEGIARFNRKARGIVKAKLTVVGETNFPVRGKGGVYLPVLKVEIDVETSPYRNSLEYVGSIIKDGEQNFVYGKNDFPIHQIAQDNDFHCDHCGIKRKRNTVYLFRDMTNGDIRQVGHTCIKSYFGDEAARVAYESEINRYLDSLEKEFREYEDEDELSFDGRSMSRCYEFDLPAVVTLTRDIVQKYGFRSSFSDSPTVDMVWEYLKDGDVPEPDMDFYDCFVDHVEKEPHCNFIHNIKNLIERGTVDVRKLSMLVGAVGKFVNTMNDKEKYLDEWYGEVGDRIRNKEFRVVRNHLVENRFSPSGGMKSILTLVDDDGRIFVWFASRHIFVDKDDKVVLSATIKRHDTFRNRKQTVLGNGRIAKIDEDGSVVSV